jgi:hypothetical protein
MSGRILAFTTDSMKAADTLIAWNGAYGKDDFMPRNSAPPGSIALGPLQTEDEPDWTHGYACTGGAAYGGRRKLFGLPQQHHVFLD